MRSPLRILACALALLSACTGRLRADGNVIVNSVASAEYTARKYPNGEAKEESYVIMQGHFFEGVSVDGSIDRLPFRRIAEIFAPELAKRKYLPAKSTREADLLIVVHWGTTQPHVTADEMRAKDSPITDPSTDPNVLAHNSLVEQNSDNYLGLLFGSHDPAAEMLYREQFDELAGQAGAEMTTATNAQLLGYTGELRRYKNQMMTSTEEEALRLDLRKERYFLILKAYDLHTPKTAAPRRAVWTLYMNMSSAGNNFTTALDRMSVAAAKFAGQPTDHVTTLKPAPREGRVDIGTPVMIVDKR